MLRSLRLRDFASAEDLQLELGPGLNVLSGGSGEGKTVVLDALRFLSGERPRSGSPLRPGAGEAVVEAEWLPPAALRSALEEAGAPAGWAGGDEPLRIQRTLDRAGRSRARVNGEPRPLAALKQLGALLADVFGQGEAAALTQEARQRAFLDSVELPGGGPGERQLPRYVAARERALGLAERLDAARAREAARRAETVRAEEERAALTGLDPRAGELEELLAREELLEVGDSLRATLAEAAAELTGRDGSLLERLRRLGAGLERLDPCPAGVSEVAGCLSEARLLLLEAGRQLERERDGVECDPRALERVRQRIGAYREVSRRLGRPAAGLAARWAELAEQPDLSALEAERSGLEVELQAACVELDGAAAALEQARTRAGRRLAEDVQRILPHLGLGEATFQVEVLGGRQPAGEALGAPIALEALRRSDPWSQGRERVQIRFASDPSLAPASLDCASGGELSRLFLALGQAVAGRSGAPLLVFDEVDANVGARLGAAVGDCLAAMAGGRQVLAVTHLAPVAARAELQVRIARRGGGSVAEPLRDEESRLHELALMIKGSPVTPAALEQARELLCEARPDGHPARPVVTSRGGGEGNGARAPRRGRRRVPA